MNKQKTVLFACGTGIATSTVVAHAVEDALKERGIRINTRQCKATEVASNIDDVDLVVSTAQLPKDLGKPSITTLAFLTGIGKTDVLDQIEAALRD
ncbi:PTS sugar transporter subunit IIB [Phyllobacterium sp. 21LDTY02-6]|jgi:galactitol PTS system EIIB component|uniref:PTS sugar transporter subunit IIB n=1 Tax=unclassified Phyllobacterium TaxID=2638441 RepID=UPI002020CCE9|nr:MULTISPECIES: PTS sugar transporter subunit IIB [unclassified Phyllobacterium]MCO4319810.1 PTS sugar transporter subunit IIB [Phyllobacterium sp. 21LDTY02-6]MCX8280550.1 PTS sugar transporter subunit IIB [Phyllobacterium sp. 0TCS1.6C]MCX8295001.1 PTS sugar transporter subunit IIB [Phyllobacterium sp. 0TCS1.6A]